MKQWIFLLVTVCCLFSSCSEEEHGKSVTKSDEVQFSVSVATRATDTSFSSGDEIGVYAVERTSSGPGTLKSGGNYADNKRFRYTNSGFEAVDENNKIYFSPTSILDFYVYYPYTPLVTDVTAHRVTVSSDQDKQYTGSDFMLANYTGGLNYTLIPLTFTHQMTLTEVTFHTGGEKEVSSAKILQRSTASDINLQSGTCTTKSGILSDITLYKYAQTADATTFRVLLPKQDIQSGTNLLVFTVNGEERSYKATTNVSLLPGSKNVYDIALQYRISLTSGTGGTVSGAGAFDCGKTTTVTATPQTGYLFAGWYENGVRVSGDAVYSFTVSADRTLEARYTLSGCTITVSAGKGGKVSGGGTLNYGSSCTVTASENGAYTFSGWYENGTKVSSLPDYTFTVTSDRNLEARFTPDDVYVTVKFLGMSLDIMDSGEPVYGSVQINAYYIKNGVKIGYFADNDICAYVSFGYTAEKAINGAALGHKTYRDFPLKLSNGLYWNKLHLFYWSDAVISPDRMTDLTDIYNIRLDTSADTSSRRYIFDDSKVPYYRESVWVTEDEYILFKTVTNKRTTNF